MAKKFKLGKRMVDIITHHHGNATIKFFYEKALKKNSDKKISKVFNILCLLREILKQPLLS